MKQFFNGAGFYRAGMFVGAVGVALFMGIGVYYIVDYFTQFILPYPFNFVSSLFVAVFVEWKAVSLFLNGFQAIATIKETHKRRKVEHENRTNTVYDEWSGAWAVWAQFVVVVIMDTAGNAFRIYNAQQDAPRTIGGFLFYECLMLLPFLAGYTIFKQTTRPIEMIVEEHNREYTIKEIEQEHKQRTTQLKNRGKQLEAPQTVTGEFEEFGVPSEEARTVNFPQARRLKQ